MPSSGEDSRITQAKEELRKAEEAVRLEEAARWERKRLVDRKAEEQARRRATQEELHKRAQRLVRDALSEDPQDMDLHPLQEFEKAIREELKKAGKELPPEVISAIALCARMLDDVASRYAEGYRSWR